MLNPGFLKSPRDPAKFLCTKNPALFSPSCGSPRKIRCPSRDKFGQLRVQTSQTHIGDLLLGKIPKKAELSRSRSTSLLHHGLVTSNNAIRAEPGLITTAEHDSLLEQTSKTLVLSVEPSSCGNVTVQLHSIKSRRGKAAEASTGTLGTVPDDPSCAVHEQRDGCS